jgi:hypothetical protein
VNKDKLRFNNFGGRWRPHVFPAFNPSRQKLFFFAGEEFKRRTQNQLMLATTPTTDERSGIINSTATLVYPSNFRWPPPRAANHGSQSGDAGQPDGRTSSRSSTS